MLVLAFLVAILHGALVCCVVIGSAAAIGGRLRRLPRLEAVFYCLLALVIASDVFVGECVLTRWEQWLRNAAQPGSAYRGSFIGHYCSFLPPFVHATIGPILVLASLAAVPFWRWRASRDTSLSRRYNDSRSVD